MNKFRYEVPHNKLNTSGQIHGLWYPTARPLKVWRKTLGTDFLLDGTSWKWNSSFIFIKNGEFQYQDQTIKLTYDAITLRYLAPYSFVYNGIKYSLVATKPIAVWQSATNVIVWEPLGPLLPCDQIVSRVGDPVKMITQPICRSCTTGSIMSFSGSGTIRSANTNVSKAYYPNNYQYLRSRGGTFDTTSTHHKIQGVAYTNGNNPVWPVTPQTVNGQTLTSANYAYNDVTCNPSKYVVYKPNNSSFSTQGAVDSSTRLWKLKYTERPELTQFQKKALKAQLKK
jgi:hypothetical protein